MTQLGPWAASFAVLHNDAYDVVGYGRLPPRGRRETAWHTEPETRENAASQAGAAEAHPRGNGRESNRSVR
jgi:hypothetical protein